MIFLYLTNTEDTNIKRVETHLHRVDLLPEEDKPKGIFKSEIPVPEEKVNTMSTLMYNVTKDELFYVYKSSPPSAPSPEQRMEKLEASQLEQDDLLLKLVLGGNSI